ncbi:polymer-forming cytoskeletal protein [Hydrogenophaga taeniospiralis]|jgi:cytoskeletal protein CcmA (bactofilin family)|uniref:bactofilin family protein n=1 Tax=Hydrogenophaga taeniospiralis TaxID=65656 RepID=UPI001CF9D40E|nr:polymer-forming cytoskeletal protein [Hydrogenophaga taeniospiralis]MCB4365620.1 polymer-forming cytoskeletal protein [Hydrogenophaga taeniospiralis]
MKADRYLHPDRHLEQDLGTDDMNDYDNPPPPPQDFQDNNGMQPVEGNTLEIDVGRAMPPSQPGHLPLLQPQVHAAVPVDVLEGGQARSMVAEGMHFVGNAELRGPCSIAGQVDGNLTQAPGVAVAVVVTETGRVKGDITAQKISVMGHTDGILDSGQGEVSLHDTASVHGLVRYGRIQVNGADLNATLERVPVQKPGT